MPASRRAEPSRPIEPLATLPVFLKLAGRRAVVAGGTPPAVWKAELLAAAGARVEILAPEPCAELQAFADAHHDTVALVGRVWHATDLAGAAIAIGALDGPDAERFREAAQAAGVPVNVIDVPHLCDFQFGTIVARSPLVIGISTDGAAPVFGQALRTRLEALLPASIGAWARAAKDWRVPLQDLRLGFAARRRFWELFTDAALAADIRNPTEADRIAFMQAAQAVEASGTGRLFVIGAGSGRADLVTLGAVRALQSADVILHDAGLGADVLSLGRREAIRIVSTQDQRQSLETIQTLLDQRKTVAWIGFGDGQRCGRWSERRARIADSGIDVVLIPGLRCDECPRGCADLGHSTRP